LKEADVLPRNLLEKNFRKATNLHRLAQSALVAVSILVVLLFFWRDGLEFFVAALSTSAVVAFSFPRRTFSQPKAILVGYLSALLLGGLLSIIPFPEGLFGLDSFILLGALGSALFVAITAALRSLHPPAAAALLGMLLLRGHLLQMFACLMIAVLVLVTLQTLLRHRLRDLI